MKLTHSDHIVYLVGLHIYYSDCDYIDKFIAERSLSVSNPAAKYWRINFYMQSQGAKRCGMNAGKTGH